MKRVKMLFAALWVAAGVFMASGCADAAYPKAPDDGIGFKEPVVYEGREYSYYGLVNNLKTSYIDQCIGYIVQDATNCSVPDPENRNDRVYTLRDDSEHNFLLVYYANCGICPPPPQILRADDTDGQDIAIPAYIEKYDEDDDDELSE
ncbi:hypothetical protein [Butyrivibrio sp. VCD2006]|uniref:hypothetical protein n=1 Tax=Butyrivibrio sp. VCD2006 TaxID=1280664 RepID=UPI000410596F|nr:hypothetical protein [Butyrivibrio sp. VCD2006]